MSTRRERLEAKLEKRREWAASRERKSAQAFDTAHKLVEGIPLGQPILIGHHSEKRHRATIDRMSAKMSAGVEHGKMAEHHTRRAGGLEHALATSIYSDDPDALEALAAKLEKLEAERARMVLVNKLYRKGDAPALAALGLDLERLRANVKARNLSWVKAPHEGYELSNLGGNITRLRKRVEDVKRRQERTAKAEAAPSGLIVEGTGEWVRLTFAEKPSRPIIDGLKAAGFAWGGGSWTGKRAAIPDSVAEIAP